MCVLEKNERTGERWGLIYNHWDRNIRGTAVNFIIDDSIKGYENMPTILSERGLDVFQHLVCNATRHS